MEEVREEKGILQKKVVILQLSVFEIITVTQNSSKQKQQWIASRNLSQLQNGKQSHEKLQVTLPKPERKYEFREVLRYHKWNMDNLFLLENTVVSTDTRS